MVLKTSMKHVIVEALEHDESAMVGDTQYFHWRLYVHTGCQHREYLPSHDHSIFKYPSDSRGLGGDGLSDRHHRMPAFDGKIVRSFRTEKDLPLRVFNLHRGFGPLRFFTHDLFSHRFQDAPGIGRFCPDGQSVLRLLTTAFPEKERGKALGIVGSVVSAGFLTGPILGGFLVEHLGWRSIFFINLPIGAIGIYLSSKVLERVEPTGKARVDLWGALLLFFFVTSLLLFLNRVGQGSTPLLWVWLFLSLLCFSLFIIVETSIPFSLGGSSTFSEDGSSSPLLEQASFPSG